MRQPLQHRDGGHIQRGAGGGQAAAYAPLAQDHLLVAAGEDILCRQQQLLHGGGGAPLQQDGLARLSQRLQQGKVLHIPGAHLPHVHAGQQLHLGRVADLGDGGQSGAPPGLHQQIYARLSHALKGVGRGAGLEHASPQQLRPGVLHGAGQGVHLVGGLHGAGPRYQAEVRADGDVAHRDHGVLRVGGAAGQTIGGRQPPRLHHKGQRLQRRGIQPPRLPHQRQENGVVPGHTAALDVLQAQLRQKLADGRLRRVLLQYQYHKGYLLCRISRDIIPYPSDFCNHPKAHIDNGRESLIICM